MAATESLPTAKDDIGLLKAKPHLVYMIFDSKGGVTRVPEGEEPRDVPPKGFVVVSGNSKSPEFKLWLKKETGDFMADLLTIPSTRSRCTVLDDTAVVIIRVARPGADPDDIGRQLLTLYIQKGRVIVSSELNIPEFLGIAQWQQTHHAPISSADLVARLGLRAADRLEPLVEKLGDRLDAVEETLMRDSTKDTRSRLSELRRTLINFRRLVWPLRDVLNTLEIEDLSFFTTKDRLHLREASARSARLGDELQALSERAVLVHEQILDARAEQMNKTMLVLTAVTVVFMPLTLLTGALGMNVAGIPLADEPWAFWGVGAGLVLIAVLIGLFMRTRKWL